MLEVVIVVWNGWHLCAIWNQLKRESLMTEEVVFCYQFSKRRRSNGIWILQSDKVTGTCNESDRTCVRKRDQREIEDWFYAVCIYARERKLQMQSSQYAPSRNKWRRTVKRATQPQLANRSPPGKMAVKTVCVCVCVCVCAWSCEVVELWSDGDHHSYRSACQLGIRKGMQPTKNPTPVTLRGSPLDV